jgi:hypothetical protein
VEITVTFGHQRNDNKVISYRNNVAIIEQCGKALIKGTAVDSSSDDSPSIFPRRLIEFEFIFVARSIEIRTEKIPTPSNKVESSFPAPQPIQL